MARLQAPKTYTEAELDEKYVRVHGGMLTNPRWVKVGAYKVTGMVIPKAGRYQEREYDMSFSGGLFGARAAPAKRLREILPPKHPQSVQGRA